MTAPDSGNRTGRIAGVALLGLAAVALVLGLITVFGGNGDGRADGNDEDLPPRPTTSSSSRPGSPSSATTTIRPPATTTSPAPTTTTTTTGASRPPGDGNGEPTKSTPVRVLNNSKIKGLAAEAADDFKADGWQVVEVGNYSATNIATTTAYYRPGTDEEAAAKALASTFGLEVAPRISEIAGLPGGVIVIVTSDYEGAGSGDDGSKNEG
jgi:hypothetical protein